MSKKKPSLGTAKVPHLYTCWPLYNAIYEDECAAADAFVVSSLLRQVPGLTHVMEVGSGRDTRARTTVAHALGLESIDHDGTARTFRDLTVPQHTRKLYSAVFSTCCMANSLLDTQFKPVGWEQLVTYFRNLHSMVDENGVAVTGMYSEKAIAQLGTTVDREYRATLLPYARAREIYRDAFGSLAGFDALGDYRSGYRLACKITIKPGKPSEYGERHVWDHLSDVVLSGDEGQVSIDVEQPIAITTWSPESVVNAAYEAGWTSVYLFKAVPRKDFPMPTFALESATRGQATHLLLTKSK